MFCPKCRSEYRDGFTVCATCDGEIHLVAELSGDAGELRPEEIEASRAVGFATTSQVSRTIELPNGRVVDLLRVFPLSKATELQRNLASSGFSCAIVPVGLDFPDDHARFEVRVRTEEFDRAETHLRDQFTDQVLSEGTEAALEETDVESCPACGAHVPLDVEECPDCGLNVGGA